MDAAKLKTETITLNVGPQHPSTHGVFHMILTLEGETIVDLEPVVGYLHRNHEKLGEGFTYLQYCPYPSRLDYICGMTNEHAYALAVEKLAGLQVPERAEYIRTIMAELNRMVNHIVSIGFLLNDLGAFFTPVLYCLKQREKVLDLFEMASGSRMMFNYIRYGGVARDLPEGFISAAQEVVGSFPGFVDELEQLLTENEIFVARTKGIGILPPDVAVDYSCTGPLLRGSGVPYDIRRVDSYSIYSRFDFDVVTRPNGDVFDRYMVRIEEIRQSTRIVEQALGELPEGPVMAELPRTFRPPAGDAYGRIEAPKGELGFYLVSDGGDKPYRLKVRSPSFINLGALPVMARGYKVPDLVAILGSIDITLGEVDR